MISNPGSSLEIVSSLSDRLDSMETNIINSLSGKIDELSAMIENGVQGGSGSGGTGGTDIKWNTDYYTEGNKVIFDNKSWVVAHIDGHKIYLVMTEMYSLCRYHDSTEFGSYADTLLCQEARKFEDNELSESAKSVLEEISLVDYNSTVIKCKVWPPLPEQVLKFNYFSKNRQQFKTRFMGVDYSCWLSVPSHDDNGKADFPYMLGSSSGYIDAYRAAGRGYSTDVPIAKTTDVKGFWPIICLNALKF